MTYSIRAYTSGDAPELASLIHEAVTIGAARAYTREERAAWSPAPASATSGVPP